MKEFIDDIIKIIEEGNQFDWEWFRRLGLTLEIVEILKNKSFNEIIRYLKNKRIEILENRLKSNTEDLLEKISNIDEKYLWKT